MIGDNAVDEEYKKQNRRKREGLAKAIIYTTLFTHVTVLVVCASVVGAIVVCPLVVGAWVV